MIKKNKKSSSMREQLPLRRLHLKFPSELLPCRDQPRSPRHLEEVRRPRHASRRRFHPRSSVVVHLVFDMARRVVTRFEHAHEGALFRALWPSEASLFDTVPRVNHEKMRMKHT